jgi:flagellar FliJ protein
VSSPHFTFRLERVRSLRERAEDQAKEEYAASLAHRMEGVAMLRAAAEHRDQARAATRPTPDAALSGTDFLTSQAWLERLADKRRAEHVLESNRREAYELDELAAAGHRRRMS